MPFPDYSSLPSGRPVMPQIASAVSAAAQPGPGGVYGTVNPIDLNAMEGIAPGSSVLHGRGQTAIMPWYLSAPGMSPMGALQTPESLATWGSQYRTGLDLSAPGAMAALPQAGQSMAAAQPAWAQTILGARGAPADAQAAAAQIAGWQSAGSPQGYNPTAGTVTPATSNLSLYRPRPASQGWITPVGSSLPDLTAHYQPQVQSQAQAPTPSTVATPPASVTPTVTPQDLGAPPSPPMSNMGAYNVQPQDQVPLPGQPPGQTPEQEQPYSLADIYGLKDSNPLINATNWT